MDERRLMAAARKYAIGDARLGGYNGMTNIPSLSLVGRDGAALGPVEFFYVVGGLLYLSLMLCVALTRSSFGRILQGIRGNEPRMELLGYDVRWRKLLRLTQTTCRCSDKAGTRTRGRRCGAATFIRFCRTRITSARPALAGCPGPPG